MYKTFNPSFSNYSTLGAYLLLESYSTMTILIILASACGVFDQRDDHWPGQCSIV